MSLASPICATASTATIRQFIRGGLRGWAAELQRSSVAHRVATVATVVVVVVLFALTGSERTSTSTLACTACAYPAIGKWGMLQLLCYAVCVGFNLQFISGSESRELDKFNLS